MQYKFEEQQPLKFEIYDIDTNSTSLKDHDFLGFAMCNLGQIISSGKVSTDSNWKSRVLLREFWIEYDPFTFVDYDR